MTENLTPSLPGDVPLSDSTAPSTAEPLINLSAVDTLPASAPQAVPVTGSFDPERQREYIRGQIAQTLLWMLAGVLALTFISMWVGKDAEVLKTVLTIMFAPLVTLVSAATGFYYGSRSSSS